jgi:hypothetical protein
MNDEASIWKDDEPTLGPPPAAEAPPTRRRERAVTATVPWGDVAEAVTGALPFHVSPGSTPASPGSTPASPGLAPSSLGQLAPPLPRMPRRTTPPLPPPSLPRLPRLAVAPPAPVAEVQVCESTPSFRSTAPPPPRKVAQSSIRSVEPLWTGHDHAALERARLWRRSLPPGVEPRSGPGAVNHRGAADGWLTRASIADADELAAAEVGVSQAAARVVEGALSYDLCPRARLAAVRAALRRLAHDDAAISEAMAATEGLADDVLTPLPLLIAAVDELVDGAARAGMSERELRRTTHDTLLRQRKHAELNILGGNHLVARLCIGDAPPWVAYLPKGAMSMLPLQSVLQVRAAVTIHPRQDPEEPASRALRVLALARIHSTEFSD